jgi:hypothetical protein
MTTKKPLPADAGKGSSPTTVSTAAHSLQQELLDSLDGPKIAEELEWWAENVSDELAWSALGLSPVPELASVRTSAEGLAQEWMTLASKLKTAKSPKGLPAIRLLGDTKALVGLLRSKGQTLEWIGFVRSHSLENLLDRVQYVEDRLAGSTRSFQDEIAFWNRLLGVRAAEISHQMDHSPRLSTQVQVFAEFRGRTSRVNESGRSCCCGLVPDVRKHKGCLKSYHLLSLNVAQEMDVMVRKLETDLRDKRCPGATLGVFEPRWFSRVVKDVQRAMRVFQSLVTAG